jgi:hypothetical protein
VPVIIINNTNNSENSNQPGGSGSGSGSSGSSGSGSFYATTPIPYQGQGGVALYGGGVSCGGYYLRVLVFVDDNNDSMMSPAEGITGLQIFFLDQTYARLGSAYTTDGQAAFCIPPTQYGRLIYVDIPYLQQFNSIQIPESPDKDLEIWFPGEPPTLPLYLP